MQSRRDSLLKIGGLAVVLYVIALVLAPSGVPTDYLLTLPGFALMSYGCYCLVKIGRSIEVIVERDDEYISLQKEIAVAREFLAANKLLKTN